MESSENHFQTRALDSTGRSTSFLESVKRLLLLAEKLHLRDAPEVDGELAVLWARVLENTGIRAHELAPAFERHMQESEFFPSPKHIIELARHARPLVVYRAPDSLPGPIRTDEEEREFQELRRKTMARLESLGLRRMKPGTGFDQGAKDPQFVEPSAEDLAEHRRKVEDMKRALREG